MQNSLSKYLINYKKGDYVDVIADGAIQRGMPHKFYHGKTGRIFDVTTRAVGVIVNKRVNTRIVPKRIHVRVEHVRLSQSREAFVQDAETMTPRREHLRSQASV